MGKNYSKFLLLLFFLSFGAFRSLQAQTLVSVVADSAVQGQTLSVVITGSATSFGQGTTTTQAWLSQGANIIPANSVLVLSTTQLLVSFTMPSGAPVGFYDVNTHESIDGFLALTNGFKLKALATGIEETESNSVSGMAYPNPFTDQLKLRYTLSREAMVNICMYDISGRIVSTGTSEQVSPGEHLCEFDAAAVNAPPGIYFIRLNADGKDYNYKVIKNN